MKNRIDRIETIKSRVENNKRTPGSPTYKLKLREESTFLPVIKLEVDYLLYRIENSRTRRQQKGYLRLNSDLPSDFFADPESKQAQSAQEEILLGMVLNHKDFLNDLQQYGQDEPAIITYDGYLVNGNRRTVALKKMGVTYIECAVLPDDVNAKEIYQIEQDLQIAEDFREDYDWINELLNIRAGKEDERFQLTDKQLIKNLRITPQELRSRLLRIDLVDSFLEWKGIPGYYDYPMLDEAEQIFKELEKGLKKYSDNISSQNSLKHNIFSLIENRPERGRLYDHVREVIRDFDDIQERLLKTKESDENSQVTKTIKEKPTLEDVLLRRMDNKPDNLEEDEEQSIGANKERRTDTIITKNSHEEARKLIEAKEDIKAEKHEKKSTEAIYISISEALRSISGLSVNDDSTKLIESRKKLEELIRIADELLTDINTKLSHN